MKNVAVLNTVYDRSTGKIALGLKNYLNKQGYNAVLCYGYGDKLAKDNTYRIDYKFEHLFHAFLCRITGFQGGYSVLATKRLLRYLTKNKIDTVYLVSLHGYYINEKMLFQYLSKQDITVVYLMIDEYPFRGKCCYSGDCINYLNGCGNCPKLKEYPKSLIFDRSHKMFINKKSAYNKLTKKIFVGPEYTIISAKQSPIMQGINTEIIDEAIDTTFYAPRDCTELRHELNISEDKIIILCIAPLSYERKGVKYFINLAKRFENDDRYSFIHVGYDSEDKTNLPKNLIVKGYISDQNVLATYYSLADLFVFPSLLDTMPNACLEALSCGTPLLCFDVSGMPYIADDTTATFVKEKDVDAMEDVVKKTNKKNQNTINICRNYALDRYDNKKYYEKLVKEAIILEEAK